MDRPPPPTEPPPDGPPPTGGPDGARARDGWAVDMERLDELIASPRSADPAEVAGLAADHQAARFLLAELHEEHDELEALVDHLGEEHVRATRALSAAVEVLVHLTGEAPDTVLLAVGARPEWLPDHPDDGGCQACAPDGAPG